MNKPTVDLAKIVEDCELAIGEVLIKHMPLVESGDVDPMQAFALERAIEDNIKHWWHWNGGEHYSMKWDSWIYYYDNGSYEWCEEE